MRMIKAPDGRPAMREHQVVGYKARTGLEPDPLQLSRLSRLQPRTLPFNLWLCRFSGFSLNGFTYFGYKWTT